MPAALGALSALPITESGPVYKLAVARFHREQLMLRRLFMALAGAVCLVLVS